MDVITAILEWLDVVGQTAGGGGTINWEAVEAVGVLIGASFVFWQVRHINADLERIRAEQEEMRVEQTHKKWEALQWATELLSRRDLNQMFNPGETEGPIETVKSLNVVGLAAEDGYLDRDLLFQVFGIELSRVYSELLDLQEKQAAIGRPGADALRRQRWASARTLLKDAYEWWIETYSGRSQSP
jgi:hypothetical protein